MQVGCTRGDRRPAHGAHSAAAGRCASSCVWGSFFGWLRWWCPQAACAAAHPLRSPVNGGPAALPWLTRPATKHTPLHTHTHTHTPPRLTGTQLEEEALRCAYSATEDGWSAAAFHERVDGYGAALAVARTQVCVYVYMCVCVCALCLLCWGRGMSLTARLLFRTRSSSTSTRAACRCLPVAAVATGWCSLWRLQPAGL
jgi:hypothetical protein